MSEILPAEIEIDAVEHNTSQDPPTSATEGKGKPRGKQDKRLRLTMIQKACAVKYFCYSVPKSSY